ncbi:MAG: ATP-dependent DNA helicase RecG [Planctomycetota bacterium]|nr:ATP-dependent DNA helicase RecG [Planctomycetota bacterium]
MSDSEQRPSRVTTDQQVESPDWEDPLQTPVQFVRGVGPVRAKLLEKLDIRLAIDLLYNPPRDVLDLSDVRQPDQLEAGVQQSVCGSVVDTESRLTSNGKTMSAVLIRCGRAFVRGVWFNQPWVLKKFQPDNVVLFSGKPKLHSGRWEFSNPHTQWLEVDDASSEDGLPVAVVPRYGLTDGLKMYEIRRAVKAAVEDYVDLVPELLSSECLKAWQLLGIREAITRLHLPKSMDEYRAAYRRLVFQDLVEFQLAIAMRRRVWWSGVPAPKMPCNAKIDSRIRRLFPFEMTTGQDQAIADIVADMNAGRPMHRLLQADVGAGKTAIAGAGALVAIANGHQAALMTPTELLATQHWQTIDKALAHSRVKRLMLTGNLTASQRKHALEEIKSGETQLIIGTQALIQKGVEFSNLGLVVIDEQHKFGVGQRASFSTGSQTPHVLVMTATPIPRSLCLTQFGDLDLTTMSDMPPGRQPVKTFRVYNANTRKRAWKFVRERLQEGRQVYVVCPRVGEVDENDQQLQLMFDDELPLESESKLAVPEEITGSAEELFAELQEGELKGFNVGIVHGRMNAQAKADAMDSFRTGETQALVSTTVIEVGVDVSNATTMVIHQAERFGLSQLHQLRGRIGRGRHQGFCFLFSDASATDVVKRLSAMEKYTDGFKIAEVDFDLRGPGDILGSRQHGALPLRFGHLIKDRKLVEETRQAAVELVKSGQFDGPLLAPLKSAVLDRFAELMDLPRSG